MQAPELNPEDHKDLRRILGLHLVLLRGIKTALRSDFIIANSTQTRNEAIKLGFDSKNAFVVNLGLDSGFFSKKGRKQKGKQFKVGYIGAVSTTKNVGVAVNAFSQLIDKKAIFEVWGKKEGRYEELRNLAGDDPRIRFMGFAPEERLVSIYDSFDAFVHPTLYEGFGFPILEAQARNLPVITLKGARIPEEVKKYCIEVKDEGHMADKLEHLRLNGYSEKSRKRAAAYARTFTWGRAARGTVGVYREAYSERRS